MGEQYMNLSATPASRDGPWTRIWAGPPEDGKEQQKDQPVPGLSALWTPPGQGDWLWCWQAVCVPQWKGVPTAPADIWRLSMNYLGVTARQSSVIAKHQWASAWVLQPACCHISRYGSAWANFTLMPFGFCLFSPFLYSLVFFTHIFISL